MPGGITEGMASTAVAEDGAAWRNDSIDSPSGSPTFAAQHGVSASPTNMSYFAEIDEKYARMLKAGLSRAIIETQLRMDGLDKEDINDFWRNAGAHAMREALKLADQPDAAWTQLKPYQKFITTKTVRDSSQAKEGYLRIVCISDTHGLHEEAPVPDGDILIHAGDFTDNGDADQVGVLEGKQKSIGRITNVIEFSRWLGTLKHKHKIVIAGNHECSFDSQYYKKNWARYGHKKKLDPEYVRSLLCNCVYLEDDYVLVEGLKIYGSPWQPEFCNWAFNRPRPELAEKWKRIPLNTDILVTHTPPLGRGDLAGGRSRVGCVDLLQTVQFKVRPKYHIFGHVHEGYSVSSDGYTKFVNASICTHQYKPTNASLQFNVLKARDAEEIMSGDEAHTYDAMFRPVTSLLSRRMSETEVFPEKDMQGRKHKHKGVMGIAGTVADTLFRMSLTRRSETKKKDESLYSERAMKYIFSGPFRQDTYTQRRQRLQIEEEPDYTLPDDVIAADTAFLPPKLSRRFTDSLLTPNWGEFSPALQDVRSSQNETVDSQPENSSEEGGWRDSMGSGGSGSRRLRRRPGRPILENIAEEESDHQRPRLSRAVAGSARNAKSGEAPRSSSGDANCALCKYKVAGHVHEGRSASPSKTNKKQNIGERPASPEKDDCILCKMNVAGHRHDKTNNKEGGGSRSVDVTRACMPAAATTAGPGLDQKSKDRVPPGPALDGGSDDSDEEVVPREKSRRPRVQVSSSMWF